MVKKQTWSSPRFAVSSHNLRKENATPPDTAVAKMSETTRLSGNIVAASRDIRFGRHALIGDLGRAGMLTEFTLTRLTDWEMGLISLRRTGSGFWKDQIMLQILEQDRQSPSILGLEKNFAWCIFGFLELINHKSCCMLNGRITE